ncbi:MAG: TonB-dependent receptor domain-containing protein [Gemmatimonadaceae bacterium]
MLSNLTRAFALCAALVTAGSSLAAQVAVPAMPAPAGEIRGRLVETASGAPVNAGSITVRRSADTSFAGGALPNPDGSFRVNGLAAGHYTVRFRAIGFAPLVRTDVVISAEQPVVDLGALTVASIPVQLEAQQIVAERPEVTLAPDRNSYAVKNMATASGGTAIDALRNVPSVEVDGTNNVSLRGNTNVVVQINGRPSPLRGEQLGNFLAQLPAHAVDHIEVATNPSAKNDPEGTAGIINIVLAQQADMGLSGGFSAGTGTTGMANLSGNIGRQSGPWTLFGSYNFFSDTRPSSGNTARTNMFTPTPAFVYGNSEGEASPRSNNVTTRAEYRFTEHDALSADAVVSGGIFSRNNSAYYTDLDGSGSVIGSFNQFSNQAFHSLSQDYALAFRRTGDPKATTYSTELRYTRNGQRFNNLLSSIVLQSDPSTGAQQPAERDLTKAQMPSWALQTDYSHPFSPRTKLESGFKGTIRKTSNDFSAAFFDAGSGSYQDDATRANVFDYRETIGAAYGVLSQKIRKVDGQLGLRIEQANSRLELPTAALSYRNDYASAFPSAILAWNATEMRQLKASYSRRITRPDPFQLNPIGFRNDPRNAFRGNPALRPEYTDAFELGLQEARKWGSIQLTPYLRQTQHAVRFIRTVDSTGVTLGTFANVASTTALGTDLNLNWRHGPVNVFGGGSAYRYSSDAGNLGGNLSTKAFVWNARSNVSWKLTSALDLQAFGMYRAPMKTEGGRQDAMVFTNFALRQKLWGDKGSLTLRVSDPFSLMKFGYVTDNGQVIESNEQRFGVRGVYLTFSRNFGQQIKLRPRPTEPDNTQPQQPGGP